MVTLRDARDVLVSRHAGYPPERGYYCSPQRWRRVRAAETALRDDPDVTVVRYETLVRDPAAVEHQLREAVGWDVVRPFARWHEQGDTGLDRMTRGALGGVRPVDASSVGRWREPQHARRVAEGAAPAAGAAGRAGGGRVRAGRVLGRAADLRDGRGVAAVSDDATGPLLPDGRADVVRRRAHLRAARRPGPLPRRPCSGSTSTRGRRRSSSSTTGARRRPPPAADAVPGPLPVRVHRQDNAGPASARNTGARLARGRWLAFTDDDCAPAPAWLAALGAALRAEPSALVGGPTVNALHDDPWAEATQQLVSHLTGDPDGLAFLPTCNLAVARDAFAASGGFDESFPSAAGEDRAFCDAWQDAGRPLRWCADARVEHAHHLSARRFWRQHRGYGRAARAVHASRRAAGRSDGRPAGPAFHVALLRRAPAHAAAGSARGRRRPAPGRAGGDGRRLGERAACDVGSRRPPGTSVSAGGAHRAERSAGLPVVPRGRAPPGPRRLRHPAGGRQAGPAGERPPGLRGPAAGRLRDRAAPGDARPLLRACSTSCPTTTSGCSARSRR